MPILRLDEFINSRAKALRAVLRPDVEYFWRKLMRWACQELNVSIFEAEKMPIDKLLQHYYEARFEDLEDDQIDKALALVLESKEEAAKRASEEVTDAEEVDELVEMVRREAEALARERGERLMTKEEAVKAKISGAKPDVKVKKKKKEGSGIAFKFGPAPGPPPPTTPPGPVPPVNLADLPADVSVKFDSALSEEDWNLLGIPR